VSTTKQGLGRPFDDPIKVPGARLVTLRDAGEYIAKLRKAVHDAPEWQAAMEALIQSKPARRYSRGSTLCALNHGKPNPVPEPRRKRPKAYRVVK
jgi:hypothetical protein